VTAAVRARAPLRLDVAGGWTDVPPFADREGGAVVSLAVDRYAYATVRARPAGVRLASADYDQRVEAPDVARLALDGTLDLLKAAVRLAPRPEGGLDVLTRSDAPPGSGMGGSAAAAVALVGALAQAAGSPLVPHEAARLALAAERTELGVAGGTQDQYGAAYGGANHMEVAGERVTVSPLRLAPQTVAELEMRLVLCYTGVSRVSGDIIDAVMGAYVEGRPATVAALRTLRDLAGAATSALLGGDVDRLGTILSDAWRCQRDLHPSVTNDDVDRLFTVAAGAGALGGKALGAGGGGCLLFLAAPDREAEVGAAVERAGARRLDFGLEWGGLQTWTATA
jgi:D-glycero-alpha-D-manno-heptose-7-phosphate kinase